MDLKRLQENFRVSWRGFGPTPFFGLNDDLDPDRLRSALRAFADKGCAGVFMHARTGLEVPYLSEDFWERIGMILTECRRLGLSAWIYDEYNWPSGVAGGRLLDRHPEFLMPYLEYAELHLGGGKHQLAHPGRAVAAFALGPVLRDLSDHLQEGTFRPPEDLEGEVLLFYEDLVTDATFATNHAPWCSGVQGYVDLMNPAAVELYLELTHEQYAKRFPEHLGTTIPGVFTDEPQFYRGFPWTPRLAEVFRETRGYDCRPLLYQLVLDRGGYRKFRWDYYDTVERMYAESFFDRIRRWCDDHGLLFTGHLGMEERLRELAVNHGGIYRPLKAMHMPGIDALGCGNPLVGGLINMECPHFSPRAAASLSRVHGNGRVLCENGGGGGWEVNPLRLKQQMDWLLGSGVNFLNPHQALLSVKGMRKRDFPPSQFVQQPWFDYHHLAAAYAARICELLSSGLPINDAGLIFPFSALRAFTRPRGAEPNEDMKKTLLSFQSLLEFLVRHQFLFELVFEEYAEEGQLRVEDGRLRLGGQTLRVLLLPPCAVLREAAAEVLIRWLDVGGKVVIFDAVPRWNEKGEELTARILPPLRRAVTEGRAVQITLGSGLTREGTLFAILRLCPTIIEIDSPLRHDLILHGRRLGSAQLFFLANLGHAAGEARLTFRESIHSLELWDPLSGNIKPWPLEPGENNHPRTRLRFHPGQAWVLVAEQDHSAAAPPPFQKTNLNHFEIAGNTLTGFSHSGQAVVETPRGKIEKTAPPPPPPLVFFPPFRLSPEKPNLFLLEPWDVHTSHPPSRPLADLDTERYFTGRTRRVIKISRPIIKVLSWFRPFERRYRTERYFDFGGSERAVGPVSRLTGINLARWGLYEATGALTRFSEYLGFHTLMKSYPPAGAAYTAAAEFFVDFLPEELELVYEDLGIPVEFELNGRRLTREGEPVLVWDACNRAIPVRDLVWPGRNQLVMRSRQLNWPAGAPNTHSIEPVALRGDFGVEGRRLVAPRRAAEAEADWSRRGYPNYSGAMLYETEFDLPAEYLDFHLELALCSVREAAEAWVNGERLGAAVYPPFIFPLDGKVRSGENLLSVRVVNTAANFFQRPQVSGLVGPVRIVPFTRLEMTLNEGGEA